MQIEARPIGDTETIGVVCAYERERRYEVCLVVDGLNSPPICADSLEAFQGAVRQRIREQTERLKPVTSDIRFAHRHLAEVSSVHKLALEAVRQRSVWDIAHHSSALQALGQVELANRPLAASAERLREERRAFDVMGELWREMRALAQSRLVGIEETARFSAVPHSAMAYATEIEKMSRHIQDHLRVYHSSFDSLRIKEALSALDSSAYERFAPALAELESVAAALKGPWVNKLYPELSAAGVTHMAALRAAVHTPAPFATPAVAAIREALGDWRELRMPWRILPDPDLRERFYLDHGFDRNLVQLPEPAFSQTFVTVGLVPAPATAPDQEEVIDEEAILRQRMKQIYARFFRFEQKLREYIDAQMTAKFGSEWERHRCHGNGRIYQLWVKRRDSEVSSGLKAKRLIHYIDFREYADLITKTDNWREIFKDTFQREENVRETFSRLAPVRLCTMHARTITKADFTLAAAEIARLLIAIGVAAEDPD